jgi:hypothetical protein
MDMVVRLMSLLLHERKLRRVLHLHLALSLHLHHRSHTVAAHRTDWCQGVLRRQWGLLLLLLLLLLRL